MTKYKCAGKYCPGLPYRASDWTHPPSCNVPPDGEEPKKVTRYSIAYDVKLKRPGCPILQATLGATITDYLLQKHFDEKHWLLSPTKDLALYPIDEHELPDLERITKEANREIE